MRPRLKFEFLCFPSFSRYSHQWLNACPMKIAMSVLVNQLLLSAQMVANNPFLVVEQLMRNAKRFLLLFFVLCSATSSVSLVTSLLQEAHAVVPATYGFEEQPPARQLLCADHSLPLTFCSFLETFVHGLHHELFSLYPGLLTAPLCVPSFFETSGVCPCWTSPFREDLLFTCDVSLQLRVHLAVVRTFF